MKNTPFFSLDTNYEIGAQIWSSGYHYFGNAIKTALPVLGQIEGRTHINYTQSRNYSISGVLKLTASINEGISGAPLVLVGNEKVVGIVNTAFNNNKGSFAVPLSLIPSGTLLGELLDNRGAELKKAEEHNRAQRAEDILKMYSVNVIRQLQEKGLFLPDKFCNRSDFSAICQDFLSSESKILPVLGSAGVGKTNAMANLTTQLLEKETVVFFPAYRGGLSENGLKDDLIYDIIFQLADKMEGNDRQSFNTCFETLNRRFVIILDGFNEIQQENGDRLKLWIERSMTWISKADVKLLVSCKPEFWELYKEDFSSKLLYVAKNNEPSAASLTDFNSAELSEALHKYGLQSSLEKDKNLAHPLLLRFFSESREEEGDSMTYVSVFEKFAQKKCQRIAKTYGFDNQFVYNCLLDISQASVDGYVISEREFYKMFRMREHLSKGILSEQILINTGGGYRFCFDQFADYLSSEAAPTDWPHFSWEETLAYAAGASRRKLPWSFVKLESGSANRLLWELVKDLDLVIDLPEVFLFNDIIVLQPATVERYKIIHSLYTRIFINTRGMLLAGALADLISKIKLSFAEKLNLIQVGMCCEHYYEWEPKHWRELSRGSFVHQNFSKFFGGSCAPLLLDMLQDQPMTVVKHLVPWLRDKTKLSDGYDTSFVAHLFDVAKGVIFHFGGSDLATTLQWITDEYEEYKTDPALDLLWMFARERPSEVTPILTEWLQLNKSTEVIAELAPEILSATKDDAFASILKRTVTNCSDDTIHLNLQIALTKTSSTRKDAIKGLFRFAEKGDSAATITVAGNVPEYFEIIFQWLKNFVNNEVNTYAKGQALRFVWENTSGDSQMLRMAEYASAMFTENDFYAQHILYAIEIALPKADVGSVSEKVILALTKKSIRELSSKYHTPVIHCLSVLVRSKNKQAIWTELLNWLIDEPKFRKTIYTCVSKLINNGLHVLDVDGFLPFIEKVASRYPDSEGFRELLSGIMLSDSPKAYHLFIKMNYDPAFNTSKYFRAVEERVNAGNSLPDAIRETIYSGL